MYLLGRFPVRSERAALEEMAAAAASGVEVSLAPFHAAPHPLPVEFDRLAGSVSFLDRGRQYGRLAAAVAGAVSALGTFGDRGLLRACCEPAPRVVGARAAVIWRRARLARLLSLRRPSLLHAQFGHLGLLALPTVRRLEIPLALSFRGQDVALLRAVPEVSRRALFDYAARVFARCEDMAADLRALGCPQDRLFVLPSGLDPATIPFRERTPPAVAQGETVRIVFVGRRTPKKGLADAERAVAALGKGYAVAFQAFHDAPHVDVMTALQEAHLFLLPCRTGPDGDKEGIPHALKEAMAAGLPILSTRHGGIPECVGHEAGGLLSEEGDFGGLLANLRELLDHPERWAEMGRRNRAAIERRYDLKRLVSELVGHYHEVDRRWGPSI